MKFIAVINFKAYKEAIGKRAISLAKRLDIVAKKCKDKARVILVVSNVDLANVSKTVKYCEVFSEHIDDVDCGAHTGAVLIEDIKANGGRGALINHSEDRRDMHTIENLVKKCKIAKITSIVCVESLSEGKKVDELDPDFIAFEPKELIGGKISVSKAKPDVVKAFSKGLSTDVLCGAGIHNGNDVKVAVDLGVEGILVASAITRAKLPGRLLKEMIENA